MRSFQYKKLLVIITIISKIVSILVVEKKQIL